MAQVWLAHEYTGEFGVEEFDTFIFNTPRKLLSFGIYSSQVAVPFHAGEHRKVCRSQAVGVEWPHPLSPSQQRLSLHSLMRDPT